MLMLAYELLINLDLEVHGHVSSLTISMFLPKNLNKAKRYKPLKSRRVVGA